MYDTLILIEKASTITSEQIASVTKNLFEPEQVSSSENGNISVSIGEFFFSLFLTAEPHVLIESQELAQNFAKDRPEQAAIAQCTSRIELSATGDPFMERFNDYCYLLEAVEKMGKVYTFDSAQAKFVNLP